MFGFISALLNAILSITPQAMAGRRKSQERELGARLFQLYLIAYEITENGDRIIRILQMARSVMNSTNPKSKPWWTERLSDLLAEQGVAFGRLEDSVVIYGVCLAALDPETFGALRWRFDGKHRKIEALQRLFGGRSFPLEARQEYADKENFTALDDAVMSLARLVDIPPQWNEEVNVLPELNEATVSRIEEYLDKSNPANDLTKIRELLKALRSSLDENYKVSDILLELLSANKKDNDYTRASWMSPYRPA